MSESNVSEARAVTRVRHPLRFRLLTVAAVTDLTPSLRRIELEGDLDGFTSLGFDDHVKLFPIGDDEAFVLPTLGPGGPVFAEPRPVMRDYTPRTWDGAAGRLTLDFATGHGGPATEWAMQVRPGSRLGIGGPRGSFIVPTAFARHVLIGDETAIPAISRRLEELPAGVQATVVIAVDGPADRLSLTSAADLAVLWVERNGAGRGETVALVRAVEAALAGVARSDAYVWIAAEAGVARTLRGVVVGLGFDPKAMKAAGYWRVGGTAEKETIEG